MGMSDVFYLREKIFMRVFFSKNELYVGEFEVIKSQRNLLGDVYPNTPVSKRMI